MEATVKYPKVKVKLTGHDGNAFYIIGAVQRGLRLGGVPGDEIEAFVHEATSQDYDHLLRTCMEWVNVT